MMYCNRGRGMQILSSFQCMENGQNLMKAIPTFHIVPWLCTFTLLWAI